MFGRYLEGRQTAKFAHQRTVRDETFKDKLNNAKDQVIDGASELKDRAEHAWKDAKPHIQATKEELVQRAEVARDKSGRLYEAGSRFEQQAREIINDQSYYAPPFYRTTAFYVTISALAALAIVFLVRKVRCKHSVCGRI
jgi:hypothetical protein